MSKNIEGNLHPSHVIRSSDASTFDVICTKCGAKDITGGGWGDLRYECKMVTARKEISEAEYIKILKTIHPNISKEDIEWHLSLSRQSKFIRDLKTLDPNISTEDIRKALGNKGRL